MNEGEKEEEQKKTEATGVDATVREEREVVKQEV